LYQIQRGLLPEQVFAQILTGFELASADSRVVGINLVLPEDWYIPMHDFHLHMKMLDFLHPMYPKVHISLHAGELAMGLVPPEGLRFHIRESVELGHAERIGHGVDVMNEREPLELLREMARRKILVEICLTSNDVILGVRGDDHPFPIYRQYHVPLALATDDEGVSRSDMTREYLRAVEDYRVSYVDLKGMARESLEHGFLPGASLWTDLGRDRVTAECSNDRPASSKVSIRCHKFLKTSEKAQLQWILERDFVEFERQF
jgi:adenosine deaminase